MTDMIATAFGPAPASPLTLFIVGAVSAIVAIAVVRR